MPIGAPKTDAFAQLFFKTKMCNHFTSGKCHESSSSCRFAHSVEELRPLPNLEKTKLCENVLNGVVCSDPECSYAHARQELRTSHAAFYKATLCRFHNKRKCLNGDFCRFAHGYDELRSAAKDVDLPSEVPKKPRKKGRKIKKTKSEASQSVTEPPESELHAFVTPLTSAVTSHVSSFASHPDGRSATPSPVNWLELIRAPHLIDMLEDNGSWSDLHTIPPPAIPVPTCASESFQSLRLFPGTDSGIDDDLGRSSWGPVSPIPVLMPSPTHLLCSLPAGVLSPKRQPLVVFESTTPTGRNSPVGFSKFPGKL